MYIIITAPYNALLLVMPVIIALNYLKLINTSANKNELLDNGNIKFKLVAIKFLLVLIALAFLIPVLTFFYNSSDNMVGGLMFSNFLIESFLAYFLVRVILIKRISSIFSDIMFAIFALVTIFSAMTYFSAVNSEGSGAIVVMFGLVSIMFITYLISFISLLVNYYKNKDKILGLK